MSAQRSAGALSNCERLRGGLSGIAFAAFAAALGLLAPSSAFADDNAPIVSPDRIEEAPSIKPDPYPDFDNFAWRAFIALNWPSLTDPAHRGNS